MVLFLTRVLSSVINIGWLVCIVPLSVSVFPGMHEMLCPLLISFRPSGILFYNSSVSLLLVHLPQDRFLGGVLKS